MKKFVSARLAGNILLISLGLLLVFHVLVLLKILPPGIIWGGQANTDNLLTLEITALAVTLFFGFVTAAKAGYIRAGKLAGTVNVLTWIMFAYLLLNTLGNLASGVSAENFLFAPVTLIMALCALRLAVGK